MIFRVPELSRVTVPAAVAGEPGRITGVRLVWPSPLFLSGIIVIPSDGSVATLAKLALSILDENDENIISDGRGTIPSGNVQPNAMPGLALGGRGFRPFPIQRIVNGYDRYLLGLLNFGGADIIVAAVGFYAEDIIR